ncbi:ATP-binding protein [Paenibacillus chitinolyticus]|uniref:sensor histidine kinase n=1 Tax=Paenibacillus chitinolyticus TaxID=79263 RepID=UPI003557347E
MKQGRPLTRAARLLAPRSLQFQLLSRSLYILAALLVLVGALQSIWMKNFLYRNRAETMSIQLNGLPRDLLDRSSLLPERHGKSKEEEEVQPGMERPRGPVLFLPDTSLAYIAPDGTFTDLTKESGMISPQLPAEEYTAVREKMAPRRPASYKIVQDAAGTEQLVVFRPAERSGSFGGIIQMGTGTAQLQAVVLQQLWIYGALVVLALAGGLALNIPVMRRTLQPLNKMVEAVEQTDAGNLNERFPETQGQLEIDSLAKSFNGMLQRLETSFIAERDAKEQMRRFIADASHELRTPLTSIHGFLEVLLRGAADNPKQLYAALTSMHGESTRIKKLVEDLLTLAKLDRAPQLQLSDTRLDRLLLEMEPHLRMLAGTRTVHIDLTAGVRGTFDPDKMKQVILNLFHNAVQHTDPETGVITVILSADRDGISLKVKDNGPGIPEEHAAHVFERFYRSDSSRTRKHGGAGLGLSITKSIVEAHGGTISVRSREGAGSTFVLTFPENGENNGGKVLK